MVFKFGSLAPSKVYHKHVFDWFIVDVLPAYLLGQSGGGLGTRLASQCFVLL